MTAAKTGETKEVSMNAASMVISRLKIPRQKPAAGQKIQNIVCNVKP